MRGGEGRCPHHLDMMYARDLLRQFKVQVPKRGCVMDIKTELKKLTKISTDLVRRTA